MSLPPGFLDELRSRLSLAQVVGRKVVWDTRKSQQGKGDMWAPCPFHQEKSASFHVMDREGYYYCFGCHAKGDAISFVRETENVSFIEAVRILAGEAGLEMPQEDPRAKERSDRRTELSEVMEEAVKFYRLQLRTGAGSAARDYLKGRGLDDAACERWEIGFAPDDWRRLGAHLRQKGIDPEMIQAVGLEKVSDRGGQPYDVFRNRILFPIRDARGRAIAFGGRAMDPTDTAKYLNSPETELFDKGRNLFNLANARREAGRDVQLIVAEGYMDVIALAEAGFGATVAPLGTAVTEDQLKLLWRVHDEPVFALDGDRAGQAAALRVAHLALPLIEAGKSLRFCMMPEGLDPDDLLRTKGAGAMQELLEAAVPMVDLLWRAETEGRPIDSPERRAALDKRLREVLGQIKDQSIKRHYGDAFKERRYQLFNPRRTWTPRGKRRDAPASANATTRSSELMSHDAVDRLREAVVLALLLRYPALIETFEAVLERLDFSDPDHARLCDCLLATPAADADGCRAAVEAALGAHALEKLHATRHLDIVPALRSDRADIAQQCLAEELAKLAARQGAAREIEEALGDIGGVEDEALTWRLSQAAQARAHAERSQGEDRRRFDLAPNGVRLDREERSALDRLLSQIGSGTRKDGK